MLLTKHHIFGAVLGLAPLTAQAWEHTFERGVDLYRVTDGNVAVSIICDPNTVYGTTNSALLVGIDQDLDLSAPVTFRFPDLITIQATLTHGRIAKAENEGGAWEPLIAGLRSHSDVQLTVDEATYNVNLGERVVFTCL